MSEETAAALIRDLEAWEARFHAARDSLTLKNLHELREIAARLAESIELQATGPSTRPITLPDSD